MFPKNLAHPEILQNIICKLSNPCIDSHHDVLISTWTLTDESLDEVSQENIAAPIVPNHRHKVLWTDAGIEAFQELVLPQLERLQGIWLPSSPSKTSLSLLLESTTNILTSCASLTNKTVSLASHPDPKSRKTPRIVRLSANKLLKKSKKLKSLSNHHKVSNITIQRAENDYKQSRSQHRKLVRQVKAKDACVRDSNLANRAATYRRIKSSKRATAGKLYKLKVGKKTYTGAAVKDGFYDSISQLKVRDCESLQQSEHFQSFFMDFSNIVELCKAGSPIPRISEEDSFKLLQRMKPDVCDFYGVTPNHYNFAGPAGWKHFYLLLNALIADVDNITITEVNTVYACILFKGHGKDKSNSRSYRTISSCPVVAKALDLYIRDMNIEA